MCDKFSLFVAFAGKACHNRTSLRGTRARERIVNRMKKTVRLLALLTALVMAMALSLSALAEGETASQPETPMM